jgi:hypothetical protein
MSIETIIKDAQNMSRSALHGILFLYKIELLQKKTGFKSAFQENHFETSSFSENAIAQKLCFRACEANAKMRFPHLKICKLPITNRFKPLLLGLSLNPIAK